MVANFQKHARDRLKVTVDDPSVSHQDQKPLAPSVEPQIDRPMKTIPKGMHIRRPLGIKGSNPSMHEICKKYLPRDSLGHSSISGQKSPPAIDA